MGVKNLNLSIKLKELRAEKGKTQKEVGEFMKIQKYTFANWEQGRAEPSAEDLVRLADYFDVSVDYLLGREDETGARVKIEGAPTMTTEERDLLRYFRSMTAAEKRAVFETAKAFYNNHAQNGEIVRI